MNSARVVLPPRASGETLFLATPSSCWPLCAQSRACGSPPLPSRGLLLYASVSSLLSSNDARDGIQGLPDVIQDGLFISRSLTR